MMRKEVRGQERQLWLEVFSLQQTYSKRVRQERSFFEYMSLNLEDGIGLKIMWTRCGQFYLCFALYVKDFKNKT